MNSAHRVIWGVLALIAIIAIGITGYMTIEGWSFLDALYMTIITITTVGYNEVHSLSSGGRVFSIFLIIGGVGGALYALTGIVQYVVEGNIRDILGRRRMEGKIAELKKHFILCGLGRVGEEIARTFKEEGVPFIVIDNRPERISQAEAAGYLYLQGDATSDEVLKEAGIERAQGLVATLGSDADNTYITLSARVLRPDLFIETRASDAKAEKKLKRAGADRVVAPNSIGGRRMAMLALRPAVVDFIDTIAYGRRRELHLENIDIEADSPLVGMTTKEARDRTNVAILAMQKKDDRLIPNPPDEETIEKGDRLIVIGTKKRLATLETAFKEGTG